MRHAIFSWILVPAAVASFASNSFSDERDEVKARIEALRHEAQHLAKNGLADLARERMREIRQLTAALAKGEAQFVEEPNRPKQAERLQRAAMRLNHLRVAAENLKAAEMHDMALELTRRADELEKDLVRAKESLAREMNERPEASLPQEPPTEVQKAYQQMLELQFKSRQELEEAVSRQQEAAQQQVTRALHEHISETMRRLQEENEQLRNEMRELRTMVERIAKDRKR
jgi:hypothetical protein